MKDLLILMFFGVIMILLHLELKNEIEKLQTDMIVIQTELGSAICARISSEQDNAN